MMISHVCYGNWKELKYTWKTKNDREPKTCPRCHAYLRDNRTIVDKSTGADAE